MDGAMITWMGQTASHMGELPRDVHDDVVVALYSYTLACSVIADESLFS